MKFFRKIPIYLFCLVPIFGLTQKVNDPFQVSAEINRFEFIAQNQVESYVSIKKLKYSTVERAVVFNNWQTKHKILKNKIINNRLLSFLLLLATLQACSSENEPEENLPELSAVKEVLNFPEIIDMFQFSTELKPIENFNKSNYRPLFIGRDTSTIAVDYLIQKYAKEPSTIVEVGVDPSKESELIEEYWDNYNQYLLYFPDTLTYKEWYDGSIEIVIDTTQEVSNLVDFKPEGEGYIYAAYPLLLRNIDTCTIVVGYGSHIPMVLEVKTENNEWIPIEERYLYFSGTGLNRLALPQNHVMLSSLPITQGDEKVEMRLRLGNNYSNIIIGKLSLKDFYLLPFYPELAEGLTSTF